MHLACDARCLHPHMGGIGYAALALLRRFGRHPRDHRITAIVGAKPPPDLSLPGISVVQVEAGMIDEHFEQIGLPSILRDLGADVYLNFTFSVPAVTTTAAQIAVIHDVVFEDHPEWVEPSLGEYLRRWSRVTAAIADRIITVSDHARRRITTVYGVPTERVVRIHNALPDTVSVELSERDLSGILAVHGVHRPFLLCLGSLEAKKGVPELVSAFTALVREGFAGDVVFAGAAGAGASDLDGLFAASGVAARVKHLGYVDEPTKQALLRSASLLVYPSRYEGFGLPPLEAMAVGTPCVASDATSIPEVVGDAALLVDVRDQRLFTAALARGLTDEAFRVHARTVGPKRAASFSWERAADSYLDVCETACAAAAGGAR